MVREYSKFLAFFHVRSVTKPNRFYVRKDIVWGGKYWVDLCKTNLGLRVYSLTGIIRES